MNTDIAKGCSKNCFAAFIEGKPVGFISSINFCHPSISLPFQKVHRLVVLPDYQGIGIAGKLIEFMSDHHKSQGTIFGLTTSNPQIIRKLNNDKKWILITQGRVNEQKHNNTRPHGLLRNRLICSFKYKG